MKVSYFAGLVSVFGLAAMFMDEDNGANVAGAASHDPLADDVSPVVTQDAPAATDTQPPAVDPAKPKRVRKAKVVAKPQRGRPKVYVGKVLTYINSLTRKHGLTGARAILNAGNGKKAAELKAQRNLELVPEALGISMPTLGKFAAAAGIELTRGRRAA